MRPDQVRRYARHVLLPDVGGTGQRRWLAARAVVSDAAGAGAVALVYLAAAGVGTLVVADDRRVSLHDVGWLYELDDVGLPRVEAARVRVAALNPDVTVEGSGPGRAVVPAGDDLLAGAQAARAFLLAELHT